MEQLLLLDPVLLPRSRGDLSGSVEVLSASRVHVGVCESTADERSRALDRLNDPSAFGRHPYVVDAMLHGVHRHAEHDYAEHDGHFRVARVVGPAGPNFLAGLLAGYLEIRSHVDRHGTNLSIAQWDAVVRLPHEVFGYADGDSNAMAAALQRPRALRVGRDSALERWRIGHQFFFVVIQALAVSLSCAMNAAFRRDDDDVDSSLALARSCADAAASALRLTAEFSPLDYLDAVRPTMMPPYVRPGFSGFQTRDHGHLVEVVRHSPFQGHDYADASDSYRAFAAAFRDMYAAHAGVCSHFGGSGGPSLRMAAMGHPSDTSGVDEATKLARLRAAMLD